METTLLVASLGFFMAAFQNCAVYKSSDKTSFEGSGGTAAASKSAAAASSSSGSGATSVAAAERRASVADGRPCAQLIAEGAADEIFGKPTQLTDVADKEGAGACMVSTIEDVSSGLETAICSARASHLALLQEEPNNTDLIVADPTEAGPMSDGSYGIGRSLPGGAAEFVFVGAERGDDVGVACSFAFPNRAAMAAASAAAAVRGARLVRAIAAQRTSPLPTSNSP